MTTDTTGTAGPGRRLNPADVHDVRFTRGTMLRPGYNEGEVDRFLARVADDLARHVQEKAELRDRVRALQHQLESLSEHAENVVVPEPPSEQAVRIIAAAQQTADSYVAEAEEFSRQVTGEARAQYEEQIRTARENAGAIIQAAQEAAARMSGPPAEIGSGEERSVEELQEQAAYLKAFGQAVRVQLRSYLEALLEDVESEWGRADPAALPREPIHAPATRPDRDGADEDDRQGTTTFEANTATENPPAAATDESTDDAAAEEDAAEEDEADDAATEDARAEEAVSAGARRSR
jgi:DivIVA domain-containing protein